MDQHTTPSPDRDQVAKALGRIVEELGEEFFERGEAIRTVTCAVLAGQHSLLLGPPGTAKSELARALTARFTGARLWEILLSPFTAPTKMFGPIDVAALTRGEYRQVFDGRATTADIAFIDEIFKCSTAALNETLALLNERLYHPENGGAPIECPLISAVCASNELPTEDGAAAIYDRLLVRYQVDYLENPANFAALLALGAAPTAPKSPTTIDVAELRWAVDSAVPAVAVGEEIIDAVCTLRAALRREELVASDRRWKAAIRLLQASAFLDSRAAVDESDLAILAHILWDTPAQAPVVEREVLQLVNPAAREALDIVAGIDQIEGDLNAKAGQSRESLTEWAIKEANPKLTQASRDLAELERQTRQAGRPAAAIERAMGRQRAVHARVLTETMGIDASVVATMIGGTGA